MTYFLTWISLVLVSLSLIYLGRWVKKESQTQALIGLVIVGVTLIVVLSNIS